MCIGKNYWLMLLLSCTVLGVSSASASEDTSPVTEPILVLQEDITVCAGSAILLSELPIIEQNGLAVDLSYHTENPPTQSNEILTETLVVTTHDTIYVQATAPGCESVLMVPIEYVPSPVLVLDEYIELCVGETYDLSQLNIEDVEVTGSPITFHSHGVPTDQNRIDPLVITGETTTTIYAYSKLGVCEYILPIPVIVNPTPDLFITTLPVTCVGFDINLNELLITDLNETGAPITLHENLPASASNEITAAIVNYTSSTIIYAVAQSGECYNQLEIPVTITNSLYAGEDNLVVACADAGLFDLQELVTPNANPGTFIPVSAIAGFDPVLNAVDTDGLDKGVFNFEYIVAAQGACLPDTAFLSLEIMEATNAGIDKVHELCATETAPLDMFQLLEGHNSNDGIWRQLTGSTLNLTNPSSVSYAHLDPDTLIFQYILEGIEPCMADTSQITIDITPTPDINGLEYRCSDDLEFYTLAFWTDETEMSTTFGTIIEENGEFLVENIPGGMDIVITVTNEKGCVNTQNITAPECDCAFVPNPAAVADVRVCLGDPVAALSIAIYDGYGANWFDAPEDGNMIAANTVVYLANYSQPGTYTFYVETFLLSNPACKSTTRTPVQLEILAYPPSTVFDAHGCVTGSLANFDFPLITETAHNGMYAIDYFLTYEDAELGQNELPDEFLLNTSQLGTFFASVTNGGICQTIVEIPMVTSPNPDVIIDVMDVSCGNTPDGGVSIINNDPSQTINFSLNNQDFGGILSVSGLYAGNNFAQVENEFGCTISEWVTIGSATSFEIKTFEFECFENGTPADPTDDYQVLSIMVESTGGSPGYEVNNGTDNFGTFTFGGTHSINLPVDGTYYNLEIADLGNPACKEYKVLGELKSCSTECGITNASIIGYECYNNNTPFDPFDDKFFLDVDVRGVNTSDQWRLAGDLQFMGEYGTAQRIGPFPIKDNEGVIIFQDRINSDCFFELSFDVPSPCSFECEMDIIEFNQIACDDSFTGPIMEDDVYRVSFIVANVNIGKEEYMVQYDGAMQGPYKYDELVEFQNVTPNATEITMALIDEEDQGCKYEFTVLLNPCSICEETSEVVYDTLNLNCIADPMEAEVELSMPGIYEWFDQSGVSISQDLNPSLDEVGEYNLVVQHDNLCISNTALTVTQDNLIPTANAGENLTINCIDTEVNLEGSSTHPSDLMFQWYDAAGDLMTEEVNYETSQEGSYTLIVVDTLRKCTSAADEVIVLRDDQIPAYSLQTYPSDTLTCFEKNIEISAIEDIIGHELSWLVDGEWQDSNTLTVSEQGTYSVMITNTVNGCVQETSQSIEQDADIPIVNIAFPDTINCLQDEIMLDGLASSVDPNIQYQWLDESVDDIVGANSQTLMANEGGLYYLKLTDVSNGCEKRDSVFVVQDQELPLVDAGLDDYIKCYESEYVLQGSIQAPLDKYLITWNSDDGQTLQNGTDFNGIVQEPGTYIIEVENRINYCTNKDSVVISDDPNAITDVEVAVQDPFCFGDTNGMLVVQNMESEGTNFVYKLDGRTSEFGNLFEGLVGGDFPLVITNDEGCRFDSLINIVAPYELTLDLSVEENEVINLGDSLLVNALTNIEPDRIGLVEWLGDDKLSCPDCLTTHIYPTSSTSYEILVTDVNGCLISRSFSVYVTEEVYLYFPNIFSLAPGSENNEFMFHGDRQVEEVTNFEIYDRWGNKIFTEQNLVPGEIGRGWNGEFQGAPAPSGVYIYKVEATLINGKRKSFFGDVTLIR